jgi:hypothetical protein
MMRFGSTRRAARWLIVALGILAGSCSSAGSDDDAADDGSATTAAVNVASDSPDDRRSVTSGAAGEPSSEDGEQTAEIVDRGPGADSGDSAYLFDQSKLHTFELNLSAEDLAFLNDDPTAEQYVEGTLTFEGETIGPVGIRYKGSIGAFVGCTDGPDPFNPSGAKTCGKLSMKVRINQVEPGVEFYGQRRLQFHAMNLDPTQMHERLGYWLFSEMGVPAPRSVHARLVINGEFAGLFALTEQIDGRFTRSRFEDGTGNLYKEVWPFTAEGEVRSEQTFLDGLRTNEDDGATAEIIRSFASDLLASSDPVRVVSDRMNVDEIIAYAVVDRTIRHDDGPFHWYCNNGCSNHNFYWYENPTTRTVHLIAWDLDNAFENILINANPITPVKDGWGEITDDCEAFPHGAFRVLQRSAACDPAIAAFGLFGDEYETLLQEFLAGPFSEDRVNSQLDVWSAQIASATEEASEDYPDARKVPEWEQALRRFQQALATARSN